MMKTSIFICILVLTTMTQAMAKESIKKPVSAQKAQEKIVSKFKHEQERSDREFISNSKNKKFKQNKLSFQNVDDGGADIY